MKNIVIGIEGLVGSGKTSICKELLNYIPNSIILHGGNFYRGIIFALMETYKDVELQNLKEKINNIDIKELLDKLKIEFKIENRETVFYFNGTKLDEEKLQSESNSLAVSIAGGAADNSKFYNFARKLIDMYKQNYNVILSGRDLNNIYPDLDYHLFITASLEERIKRKLAQYGDKANYQSIKENIIKRDELQEKAGYYKIYPNTINIDVTNCNTVEESTKEVLKHITYSK